MSLLEAHAALAGRRAVVIGGAGGVGRAVTLALADAGVDIAACDVDEEEVRAISAEVEGRGRRILSVQADVCDLQALDGFYDQVEAEFGAIDVLVNVAGGVRRKPFLERTRDEDERDIRLNYGYVIDSCRRAIPLIRRSGRGGSIVSFTSIEAHRGAATYGVYAGAKAATTNLHRALAVEFGAEQIRFNVIAPDATPARGAYSSVLPDLIPKDQFDAVVEKSAPGVAFFVPQKTPPQPGDLANAVLFLVSDLSRGITGTVLHVDGGSSAAAGFIDWPHGGGWGPSPQGGSLQRLLAD